MKKWTKVLSAFVVATVMSTGIAAITGCGGCDDDEHQHSYVAAWSKDETGHWHESECGHEMDPIPHEDKLKNGTDEETPDGLCDECGYYVGFPNAEKVTVTFVTETGITAPEAQQVVKGQMATKPADPKKDGYKFDGWFADGATDPFDFNSTPVTVAITLTAKWTENGAKPPVTQTVTVSFNTHGAGDIAAQTITKGGSVTSVADPQKDGSTFDGWFDNENCTGEALDLTTATFDTSVTLHAKWTPNGEIPPVTQTVTVSFNTHGAGDIAAQTITKGGSVASVADPTKDGSTFDGWFDNENCTGEALDLSTATFDTSVTLHAKWTPNGTTPPVTQTVTVSFDTHGAGDIAAQTITKGGKVTSVADPTKDGSTFDGWFDNENCTGEALDLATATFDTSVTLHAKWTPVTKYDVEFVVGEGATPVETQHVAEGGKVSRPESPKKTGSVFVDWFTDDKCTEGNEYNFNTPVSGKLTLYAKWKDPETAYDILAARADNIIAENFNSAVKEDFTVHGGVYGNAGIYVNNNGVYDVNAGTLVVGGTSSTSNIGAIVDFGVLTSVEGYFEFTMNDHSSSDNFNNVNFFNQGDTILKVMAVRDSNFAYTLEGEVVTPENEVASAKDTLYKVEFKLDADKKLTLKINGTVVFNEKQTTIEYITGFNVMTSNSGKRPNTIDNIAVCGTSVELSAYKTALVGKLNTKLAAMKDATTGTHKSHSTEVEAACATGVGAVNAEATNTLVAAYTAYNNAVKAMDDVTNDVQQAAVDYVQDEKRHPAANYTQNKDAYDAEINKLLTEKDNSKLTLPDNTADPVVAAGKTLSDVLAAIAEIDTDSDCFNAHLKTLSATLSEKYVINDYRLSQSAIMAQMVEEGLNPGLGYNSEKSYAENVTAANNVMARYDQLLAVATKDAVIIDEAAAKAVADADIANYRNADISALSESLQEAINAEKANAAKTVASGITDLADYDNSESQNYYLTKINANVQGVKTSIDGKITSAGKPVATIKSEERAAYGNFIDANAAFVDVKEHNEALATELKAAALEIFDTAVADMNESTDVFAKEDELETGFATWLSGELAKKKFTVTFKIEGEEDKTAEVAYGNKLDLAALITGDPYAANDNLMIDPDDNSIYVDDGDPEKDDVQFVIDDQDEDSGKIYSALTLYYKTVPAIKINSLLSTPKLQQKGDKLAENVSGVITFTDTNDTKRHVVEENTANYDGVDYTHRLKTGGKSGNKNNISFTLENKSNVYIVFKAGGTSERSIFLSSKVSENISDKLNDNVIFTFKDDTDTAKAINIDLEKGTYYINYTNGMSIYEIRITEYGFVKVPAVPLENVAIKQQGDELKVKVGETLKLDYILNEGCNFADLTSLAWSVKAGDEDKATIDEKTGLITAKAAGTVEITVEIADLNGAKKSATVGVEVYDVLLTDVSIAKEDDTVVTGTSIELAAGETLNLKHVFETDSADDKVPTDVKSIVWTSSDSAKVSVDNNGQVCAISATDTDGVTITLTVTMRDGEPKVKTVTITVPSISAEGITLDATAEVRVDENITLEPKITPSGASGYEIEWSSSDETIATVDKNTGKVTGVKGGSAVITATLKVGGEVVGTPATCTVTVNSFVPRDSKLTCGASDLSSNDTFEITTDELITVSSGNVKYRNRGWQKTVDGSEYYCWQSQTNNADILTITAKEKVSVTVYFLGSNDKGEAKTTKIKYKIGDDGTWSSETTASNGSVASITVTLNKGEKLILNETSGSNKTAIPLITAVELQ